MTISLSSRTNYYSNSDTDSFLNHKKNGKPMAQLTDDFPSGKPLKVDQENPDSSNWRGRNFIRLVDDFALVFVEVREEK